ncbi:phosphoribosylformylglycinamidine synthase subunit PurQ [Sorangium sp. So ce117]|uniref:phosphoribosylformylglycinamidine synthase subunit PurQ n=1 Tax=Sorangium sp. So ce117 TaxID=3133277 RepID=UPI003F63E799
MHATVVIFPGSNADAEMIHTLRDVLQVRTSTAWHRDAELPAGTDLVAIPGGFSYGDYLRCGAIARTSQIVPAIRRHAERGGLVIGVCNGFQILTEAGLLPGALTRNAHLRFECRDVFVTPRAEGPFTTGLPRVLRLPIAHAEGRYQADPETLRKLVDERAIALQYCDREGLVGGDANPNGSAMDIAGIYGGPRRNVLGLMPHPERMSEPFQGHGSADGRALFDAVLRSVGGARSAPSASAP